MNKEINEINFVNRVTENINNTEVEKFTIRFIGYDYTLEGLDLAECLSDAYKQMSNDDLVKFEEELVNIFA